MLDVWRVRYEQSDLHTQILFLSFFSKHTRAHYHSLYLSRTHILKHTHIYVTTARIIYGVGKMSLNFR